MEFGIAWILLLVAILSNEAEWYIASGVFAIAGNVNTIAKRKGDA